MKENLSTDILSKIIVYMKYAKYIPELKRRETWEEIVTRCMNTHIKKFPLLENDIKSNFQYVLDKKVLPSMRFLQFAGLPIEINNVRGYNCSWAHIDHPYVFAEACFLLLSGSGFGFSVQKHHVEKLPDLVGPSRKKKNYLVGDSIIGWADAVKTLMYSYFYGKYDPNFDFRDIRPKGAKLVTAGGKAPGPQPLKDGLHNIRKVLDNAISERGRGTKLKPIEAHDIVCFIADMVLSGGIRRSATLSLFSFDDEEMLTCKYGNWWELNPQRARANNSVAIMRSKADKEEFGELFTKIVNSNSGEPGVVWVNTKSNGVNPCSEVGFDYEVGLCNLTEINVSDIKSQEQLNELAKVSSFIGTLQASYTDFHYLREVWKTVCEKEALLGVSMTGIASGDVLKLNMKESAKFVVEENKRVAKLININPSRRTCVVKPSGTASSVLGCSSGIHAWHSEYYIRRVRVGKNEAISKYLELFHPELIEQDQMVNNQNIIKIPIKSPEGCITRKESALDLLDRVLKVNESWIKGGHVKGYMRHNVSATISVKENEWDDVRNWMWDKRNDYTGVSLLPYDGHSYIQAPFEEITKEQYEDMVKHLNSVDLKFIREEDDDTDLSGELACSGNNCEVK